MINSSRTQKMFINYTKVELAQKRKSLFKLFKSTTKNFENGRELVEITDQLEFKILTTKL